MEDGKNRLPFILGYADKKRNPRRFLARISYAAVECPY